MKRSTPDRLPIRSGSPLSDNHSRSEGNKVPDGEQQRELPFVVTGPGTGAKPRAVTQVNRISVDRRGSPETREGAWGATRWGYEEAWHRRSDRKWAATADPPA